jgi:23S rRNA G2069 N7-methylase RlmK/C1962 C5-methylase RlmI
MWKAHYDPALGPDGFGFGVGGGGIPSVGEPVSREEFVGAVIDNVRYIVVDERREPIQRVALQDRWDATRETRAAAKRRLQAECARLIDAELDRLADAYQQAGYSLPDTKSARNRHLRWLFRRLAYRDSCDTIAGREANESGIAYNADTIQKQSKELADQLRISLPVPHRVR